MTFTLCPRIPRVPTQPPSTTRSIPPPSAPLSCRGMVLKHGKSTLDFDYSHIFQVKAQGPCTLVLQYYPIITLIKYIINHYIPLLSNHSSGISQPCFPGPFGPSPRPIPRPVAPHAPAASAALPREHRRRRFCAAGTARSPAMLMVFPSGKYVYTYIYI